MYRILLVGAGSMGQAMLRRWLQRAPEFEVTVVQPNADSRLRLKDIAVHIVGHPAELDDSYRPDAIVLAVKPAAMMSVIGAYRSLLGTDCLLISVVAGMTTAMMRSSTNSDQPIIRCMPNTPASIGEGMLVCFASEGVTPLQKAFAEDLLSSNGLVMFIEEETDLDAVTAVSGSGPAYVFYFIESLTNAGMAAGLSRELALTLAKQTVMGSARMAIQMPHSAEDLRRQVTSPNGTTAAGLAVLSRPGDGLEDLLRQTVLAAKARSEALGRSDDAPRLKHDGD